MFAKVQITGVIEVVTGMHIGGSSAFSAIGAIDSPVITDPISKKPIIPGSSLKGKMRTLLAKKYNQVLGTPDNDDDQILRVFGTAKKENVHAGRLIFSDMVLSNADELREKGATSLTEVKFENTINRLTAVANPRQIERVIKGAEFDLDLVYEISGDTDENDFIDDMNMLAEGMKLLEYDYLGGGGTRGNGKIKFKNVCCECVIGDVSDSAIEESNSFFENL